MARASDMRMYFGGCWRGLPPSRRPAVGGAEGPEGGGVGLCSAEWHGGRSALVAAAAATASAPGAACAQMCRNICREIHASAAV